MLSVGLWGPGVGHELMHFGQVRLPLLQLRLSLFSLARRGPPVIPGRSDILPGRRARDPRLPVRRVVVRVERQDPQPVVLTVGNGTETLPNSE